MKRNNREKQLTCMCLHRSDLGKCRRKQRLDAVKKWRTIWCESMKRNSSSDRMCVRVYVWIYERLCVCMQRTNRSVLLKES